jgi:hypothetical protein
MLEASPFDHAAVGRSARDRDDRRTALFCTRTYNRILRPGLARVIPEAALDDADLCRCFDQLDDVMERWIKDQKVPA